jgi:S1-C subfamily serine protease
VTNAHNAELIDPASVLGRSTQHDLLYFATPRQEAPPAGSPRVGGSVIAYGQGTDGSLRMARGLVLRLDVPVVPRCPLCKMQHAVAFEAQAGQGFSGGPVVGEADGRLLGIIFGFLDEAGTQGKRTMYAYPMDLVLAEVPAAARPKDAGSSQPELLLLAPEARR